MPRRSAAATGSGIMWRLLTELEGRLWGIWIGAATHVERYWQSLPHIQSY